MDMSLREWLILIGAVILIGILLDGYRRMLRARRDSLEISRSMGGNFENTPLDDGFNPELPNGGARIIGDAGSEGSTASATKTSWRNQEQDEDDYPDEASPFRAQRDEPFVELAESDGGMSAEPDRTAAQSPQTRTGRFPDAVRVLDEAPKADAAESTPATEKLGSRFSKMMHYKPTQPVHKIQSRKERKAEAAHLEASQKKAAAGAKKPQEIIIINVLSKDEKGFDGQQLRRLVEACGMEFGEMSVFTRHEHDFGQGPIQFGMANAVEPGTFDIETMNQSHTPGVCFFLSLPGPEENMRAFEYMLETAQCVVRNLNGEMKDERRSVFTQQTIEHCRQRVREFERRQQLAARV